jgi:hypothetical protein
MVLIRFIYPKRNRWYNEGFRRKTFIHKDYDYDESTIHSRSLYLKIIVTTSY